MKSGNRTFPVCVSKIFYSTEKEKGKPIDAGQQAKYHDKWKVIETVVPNKLLVFFPPAGASVPFHFVCKRLVVLNHLALLRWRGGGPGSGGGGSDTNTARHPP